jgi:hypothetical protein
MPFFFLFIFDFLNFYDDNIESVIKLVSNV